MQIFLGKTERANLNFVESTTTTHNMDIASLLAAADAELTETKGVLSNESTQRTEEGPSEPPTVEAILRSAAVTAVEEERREVQELMNEAAEDIEDNHLPVSAEPESPHYSDDEHEALDKIIKADKAVTIVVNEVEGKANVAISEEEDDDDENDYDAAASKELIFAVCLGKVGQLKGLLDKGADVKHIDRHGWNSVHWAASRGDCDAMEVLLRHYTNKLNRRLAPLLHKPDTVLAGWTPLHIAAINVHLPMVRLLLEQGASIHRLDRMGETPYDVVGKGKNAKVIRRLLNPQPPAQPHRDSGEGKGVESEDEDRRHSLRR